MALKVDIRKSTYFDSVSLMSLSTQANGIEGVEQVVVAMATDMNKEVLRSTGMATAATEEAGSGDLMIVVKAPTEEAATSAIIAIEELLVRKNQVTASSAETTYATLDSAVRHLPEANLAVISVPGDYAAREAWKALHNGLHVMIFSDNVSIEDEVALKKAAHEKGLLVMGPDCGTAIIANVGLCFANNVRKGNIGIVGASGTGSQEISVRIHDFGGGISQLIGTGGRDLSEQVGGIMMIDAMRALAVDPATEVIVLVSKPPAKSVEDKVLGEIRNCGKPVIVCFLGGSEESVRKAGGIYAKTTKEAALQATILGGKPEEEIDKHSLNLPLIAEIKAKLRPEQKYIRALMCGGTLCDEIMLLVKEMYDDVYSNIAKDPAHKLKETDTSRHHTFIDFGDDAFTRGRPHPMIDPSLRIQRFLEEARDPSVGVIALDFIIGYGAHADPVGVMLPAIHEAKALAKKEGKHLEILGYVLGTDRDVPSLDEQIQKLMDADVTIASSCTNTGLLSRGFVEKGE